MKILQSNKSKFIAMLTIVFLALFSIVISAQDKDRTKSKLDQLNGKVEKITVKVDGKDVVFEGKEAEKLAKQLRKPNRIEVVTENDEGMKKGNYNVMMLRTDDKDKSDTKKKIQVEDKNGEKTVTVTTTKDGKEETKTYKGEDAEKFLKEQDKEKHFKLMVNDDDDMPHGNFLQYSFGGDDEGCCCCKHKMMMRKHSPGKIKYMILKDSDDDDKSKEEKSEKK